MKQRHMHMDDNPNTIKNKLLRPDRRIESMAECKGQAT